MAGGNVSVVMSSKAAKLLQDYDSIIRKESEIEGGISKIGRETEKTRSSFQNLGASVMSQARSMVVGFATVGAAVSGIRYLISQAIAEMDEAAKHSIKIQDDIRAAILGAGDMPISREVRQMLRFRKGPLMTEEAAVGAYRGLRGELPDAGIERIQELFDVMKTAPAAGILTAPELEKFAGLLGTMSKLDAKKTVGDLADLATITGELTGKFGTKFERGGRKAVAEFTAGGGEVETGMAFVLASLKATGAAEGASSLFQKLTEKVEPERRAPEALRRFAEAGPERRLAMLERDSALIETVFKTQSDSIRALMAAQPRDIEQQIRAGESGNVFVQRQAQFAADPEFRRQLQMQAMDVQLERAKRTDEIAGMEGELTTRWLRTAEEKRGGLDELLVGLREKELKLSMALGAGPETALRQTRPGYTEADIARYRSETGIGAADSPKILSDILDEMKALNSRLTEAAH